MKDYRSLARVYLRMNRVRSIVTIIGVAVTVIVLYCGMNLAYSYLLYNQDLARANTDYEFILLADSKEDAEKIAADERIKKAYIGDYEREETMNREEYRQRYGKEYEDSDLPEDSDVTVDTLIDSALYATSRNPYFMQKTMNELAEDYDVEAVLNYELADYYLQDGSYIMFYVVLVLLLAYILAIFAVGIIRNTIQMFMLEQMKDYGILRCIGATKKQLGKVIYRMGMYIELTGMICGFVLGGAVSRGIGMYMSMSLDTAAELHAGYHLLPIIPVVIAYLGDLYFVMRECSKQITGISPTEAVRGEYRFRKEKLKVRGRGLMGRLFGVEGEYARKSAMRNRGRLAKTVFGVSFSVAAFITIISAFSIKDYLVRMMDDGYMEGYQFTICELAQFSFLDLEYLKSDMLDESFMQSMADDDAVLQAKKVYGTYVYMTDAQDLYDRCSDRYKQDVRVHDIYLSDDEYVYRAGIKLYGLDETDLSDLSQYLVDGTTDVSENGIILVTGQKWYVGNDRNEHVDSFDYKVGDTIDIVDTQSLYGANGGTVIWDEMYDELVAEGKYKTYTVEGILDVGDIELEGNTQPTAYTSLSNYLNETGLNEDQISGMKYQIDTKSLTALNNQDKANDFCNLLDSCQYGSGGYSSMLRFVLSLRRIIYCVLIVAGFVFSLSAVNIINTTLGSLHMRRREFAQLRVIGMSKDRLIKMVMLEGLMTLVRSSVIGVLVGVGLYAGTYYYINMVTSMKFSPPIAAIIIALVISAVLICGSIYFPLRRLPQSMALDLTYSS